MEVPPTSATMARAGVTFCVAAGFFGFLAIALPSPPEMDEPLLAAASGAVSLMGILLILGYDRLPTWVFHVGTMLGSVFASLAAYAWGIETAFPFPYVWVTLFAFFFFAWRRALAHAAFVAVCYAAVLALGSPVSSSIASWAATVGTLFVTGMLVSVVRDRLEGLIANLSDAVRRDPLTDLLNRRGFEEVFDLELERSRRTGAPLSVVVGDLDRFKAVNDSFGHAAGDEVLRQIARAVRSAKRSFDSAARVGGEEFALLAPDSDEHGAYMLAERIRSEVESRFAASPVPLTISLGVATSPLQGHSPEALMRAADQALYAAKRLGRNRTVISSAEVPGILARAPRGHEDSHVELATLLNLAEALDLRDSGNSAHCHRVGRFAELMARELGLAPESVERVRLAGILHDVGNVGMPDRLLSKTGPLTADEWAWIRSHPEIGARMVDTTDFDDIRSWVLLHHERPDRKGYPVGRDWDDVPLEARIIGVADAYEAMTSERPYRSALPPDEAARQLRGGSGRQFDEEVVDALLRVV